MAESTIREDVIKIIMDIDGDDELEKLKKQLTGTKEETDKVGKSKGFDGLKKSIGVADNAAKKMLGTLGKVAAKTAKLTFKATAAGITAGATAVGVLAKQAVGAYSEFEQLKGGVDTLFGAKGTANVEEYTKLIGTSTDEIKKLQKEAGIAVDGIIGKDTTAAIEKKYKSLIDTQDMVLKMRIMLIKPLDYLQTNT